MPVRNMSNDIDAVCTKGLAQKHTLSAVDSKQVLHLTIEQHNEDLLLVMG